MSQWGALAPQERIEVRNFIEFLLSKKMRPHDAKVAMAASESVAARYWDNEDDAEYDKL